MIRAGWSVTKALVYGAFAGGAFVVLRPLVLDQDFPNTASSLFFYIGGGIVGGAIAFALIAAFLNFLSS